MTRIVCSAATDVGRVRKVNEDSHLSLPDRLLWLVADGMGGHAAGDLASAMVRDTVAMVPKGLAPADKLQAVRRAILDAHDRIGALARARGDLVIGTTVAALILSEDHFAVLWAGDSRVYLWRGGALEPLTCDHSVPGDLVMAGALTWEEAERHPQANVITRAVGVGEELMLDKVRGELHPGDRFLLCSDGLTKHVPAAGLAEILSATATEDAARVLVARALAAGGSDNVTAIVVAAV